MNYRNTWQKNKIYETIESAGHISVDELIMSLDNSMISTSTIYRNLKILQEENRIKPIHCESRTLFETIKGNHYHFECLKCHRVYDIDTDLVSIKINHSILSDVLKKEVFLYGTCSHCKEKGENKEQWN